MFLPLYLTVSFYICRTGTFYKYFLGDIRKDRIIERRRSFFYCYALLNSPVMLGIFLGQERFLLDADIFTLMLGQDDCGERNQERETPAEKDY